MEATVISNFSHVTYDSKLVNGGSMCFLKSDWGESCINFITQCAIMMLYLGITNYVLKFRKVIEFESLCIVIGYF